VDSDKGMGSGKNFLEKIIWSGRKIKLKKKKHGEPVVHTPLSLKEELAGKIRGNGAGQMQNVDSNRGEKTKA